MSIETNFIVNEKIQSLLQSIILNNKLDPTYEIKYSKGSNVGDGYFSESIAVDIESKQRCLKLFLKCMLNLDARALKLDQICANEALFYNVIYPAYRDFLKERNVEDGFRNVPKCYGTTDGIIALENLRAKGYELFSGEKTMNDAHIVSVLKTFAKFHAVSFAFKHQKPKKFKEIVDKLFPLDDPNVLKGFENSQRTMLVSFKEKLNPTKDGRIIKVLQNLEDNMSSAYTSFMKLDQDSVIVKIDCWSNNVMFLYEEEDREHPSDVMLIDWQVIKLGEPVYDVMNFFYPIASKSSLEKFEDYLKFYYDELSKAMRQIGSEPDILYPYKVFRKQWTDIAKLGFLGSLPIMRQLLLKKDETQSYAEIGEVNLEKMEWTRSFQREEEYIDRLKMLTEHMVDNGFF